MLLLYLDFDGVLHHEDVRWSPARGAYMNAPGEDLFAYAQLLESQLQQLPDLRIVLSTSWAAHYGFSRAAERLPEGLRRRAIGSTWHSQMNRQVFDSTPRGLQVIQDLQRRRPTAWFALDDDPEGWPAWAKPYLVQTDGAVGISAPIAQEQIQDQLNRLTNITKESR